MNTNDTMELVLLRAAVAGMLNIQDDFDRGFGVLTFDAHCKQFAAVIEAISPEAFKDFLSRKREG